MKAVTIHSLGQANPLVDVPTPAVPADSVLIKVHATAVNNVDLAWATGKRKKDDTILGLEVSGEVVESNSAVKVGQRVAAFVVGGAYAEFVSVPANRVIPLPETVSYSKGACIPVSYLTAYQSLFWLGQLQDHQTVLIHGGAGGVGSAATQLAKALKDVTVITTSSAAKTQACKENGADYAIDYEHQDFEAEVDQITDHQGVDLIIDFIGASYFQRNLNALHTDGHIVIIGTLGGEIVDQFNLRYIMVKRATVTGSMLMPRSEEYKAKLTTEFAQKTAQLFADGKLDPVVSGAFDLPDALAAQKFMHDKQNVGKIVLKV
ncbi:zinc-binding dehydrogenase [Nicoliella spurrieriana]|uniref:Zinc-binding dehydrogenase n=1 Tax=Nicoliella spurrieriana TaxID=2925830 RepID=A0A976RS87_9LACO|nr:zinc-binding dehydrogenase [Nicoliella spurrieriana]UQS86887.1 zinc-binding dehydrogenase [Nicoliella spurrieriana]